MGSQFAIRTGAIVGVEAIPVDVEVDVGAGLPTFAIVGLADTAVQEARERVRSALRASGFELPNSRIVVNLAPGPLRKHGTGFDLPIALGILGATKQLPGCCLNDVLAVGELSLDGSVRAIPGLIAYALAARNAGVSFLGPKSSCGAALLDGLDYRPLSALSALRRGLPETAVGTMEISGTRIDAADFVDVIGQDLAVRSLSIAAAGGHNAMMVGPPGSGKTMLARRLPSILPPLADRERLETALVHSVAGHDPSPALVGIRPFRAPHHSASVAGLIGGGSPPRPGEAALAHNGVLFLDEMPEFGPAALQCLRQPLEDRRIVLVRAEGRVSFPAAFALIGAANPCPCGFLGDPVKRCSCSPAVVERYQNRIGGPLMDRIDIVVDVERPDPGRLLLGAAGTPSAILCAEVLAAREFASTRGGLSSTLSGADLLASCRLSHSSRRELEEAAHRLHLSGRGITRLMRVARTIADLDGSEQVGIDQISEAVGLRATGRG